MNTPMPYTFSLSSFSTGSVFKRRLARRSRAAKQNRAWRTRPESNSETQSEEKPVAKIECSREG